VVSIHILLHLKLIVIYISYQLTHGKQGDIDLAGAPLWLKQEWPSLIAKFSPPDVFNVNEIDQYYRALPELILLSLIQPCDQVIIQTLNVYYRSKIKKREITPINETFECESTSTLKTYDFPKNINLLETLHFVGEAWNTVNDVTIRNFFCHKGFIKIKEEEKEGDNTAYVD